MDVWGNQIMEQIIKVIRERYQLTDEKMLRDLADNMTRYHAEKGEKIIAEGDMQTDVYFLISGIVRGFYFNEQGKEITDCFVYEPGEIVISDLLEESVATITEEVIVEGDLAVLPLRSVYQLMDTYPEVMKIYLGCLNLNLHRHRDHKIALSRYCAENRYRWMKRTYPGLMGRIKIKHIASYLNITPQTMSNLRKREQNERIGTAANGNPSDADHEI